MAKPVVWVVLGSGGHTTEMMSFIRSLGSDSWRAVERFYHVASSDTQSEERARVMERELTGDDLPVENVIKTRRSRAVGQSRITAVFTTLLAFMQCVAVLWSLAWRSRLPSVVLCNGPGTCVPAVIGMRLVALLFWKRVHVMYIETFAAVERLSLTGRIFRALRLTDTACIQWETLRPHWPQAKYVGRLGPGWNRQCLPELREGACVVTVGTTVFPGLIRAVDSSAFIEVLREVGIGELFVQVGPSEFHHRENHGVRVTTAKYDTMLSQRLAEEALVVCHAGAGTILDAFSGRTRVVAVPNRALAEDHQMQLVRVLESGGFLISVDLSERADANFGLGERLAGTVRRACSSELLAFPPDSGRFREEFEHILRGIMR